MSESKPISILLIDDHPLIRKGIIQLLELHKGITLAGEANGGTEGLEIIEKKQPDMVLLDLNMSEMDGITTLKKIKKSWPDIRVVILTVSDNPQNIIQAFRNKADGYLLKNTDPEKIVDHLIQVMHGVTIVSPEVSKILAQSRTDENNLPELNLTRREDEVLRLIAEGLSNQDVGDRLGISVWTAKVHAKHILKKLGLSTRNELIVWAIREGITNSKN